MEVQPINIQLNASTDEESETETSILQDASSSVPPGFTANYVQQTMPDAIIGSFAGQNSIMQCNMIPVYQPCDAMIIGEEGQVIPAEIISEIVSPEDVRDFIPCQTHLVDLAVPECDDAAQVVPNDVPAIYEDVPVMQTELMATPIMTPDLTSSPLIRSSMTPSPILSQDMPPSPVIPPDMPGDANLVYDMNNFVYAMPTGPYPAQYIDLAQCYDQQSIFGCYTMAPNPIIESDSTLSVATSPMYDPAASYLDSYPDSLQSDTVVSHDNSQENTPMVGNDLQQEALPSQALVYPSLYVSSAGLLTIFLRHDVAIELTLDRAIRVVNNRHRAVAATNNNGNCSCIHHPAAKIYQEDNTTESHLFWDRHAKLTSDRALFACGNSCFQLGENGMQCALPEFSELSNDMSVTLLFSSSGYGPQLTSGFEELVSNATYRYYKDGGISVHINGIKINQNSQGDVMVTAGRKFIRASPVFGSMFIETPLIQMSVEMNWNVKIQRGDYRLNASLAGLIVSDGTRECGFDQYQQVFIQPITVRKQAIVRNGMSVTRPWGHNNNNNWHNDRYNNRCNDRRHYNNRYDYNRYQNYCNMNYNNNRNNNNRSRRGSNYGRYQNNSPPQSSYREGSPYCSSNSLHDSSTGTTAGIE